jgi:hypothetical protein
VGADALRYVSILAIASLAFASPAVAQNFILKGELTTQDGATLEIKNFAISTINSANSERIDIADNRYQKKLRISDYSNTTMLFDFPFPKDKMLFSTDEYELNIGSNTSDDAQIVKNFSFFRPAAYAGIVAERIGNIDSIENCDEFSKLGNRLNELSALSPVDIVGTRSNVFVLSRSGSKLLRKMLFHKCGEGKVGPVTDALTNFANTKDFSEISSQNKTTLGEDFSYAARQLEDMPSDTRRDVFSALLPLLDKVIPDPSSGNPVEIGVANLFYAKAQFLRLNNDLESSKGYIVKIIANKSTKNHTDIEGSLLYDFFLILSGAKKTSDEPEYVYNLPLPSEADFRELSTPENTQSWCWLRKEYVARPILNRTWQRQGKRSRMRQEMAAIKDLADCKGSL